MGTPKVYQPPLKEFKAPQKSSQPPPKVSQPQQRKNTSYYFTGRLK